MDVLTRAILAACLSISVLGTIVVTWGLIGATVGFISLKFTTDRRYQIPGLEAIRQRLGVHLLLGLEIFIAGDIISSAISPSWEKVGVLGAIVAIRTVLSYFLRRELKHNHS